MAKSLFQTASITVTVNTSTTTYFPVCGGNSLNTTESTRQITMRPGGTFSKMRYKIEANSITATSTMTFRKNSGNGNQSVSIGSGATGMFTDASNTDTVAAGDTIAYQLVTGGTGTNITPVMASILFEPTDTTITSTRYAIVDPNAVALASSTRYYVINGSELTAGATESFGQIKMKKAGTLKYFYLLVNANARVNATTFRMRKNSANGNLSVSVGAGLTGVFEDSADSDTIAVDDLILYQWVTGSGTESLTFNIMSVSFESTVVGSSSNCMFCCGSIGGNNTTQGQTSFPPINAEQSAITTNRNATNIDIDDGASSAGVLSNLVITISANGVSATSTGTVNVAGASAATTVSIAAAATGVFEDTSNTQNVVTGDELSFKIIAGAGGTTLGLRSASVILTVTSVSAAAAVSCAFSETSFQMSMNVGGLLQSLATSSNKPIFG